MSHPPTRPGLSGRLKSLSSDETLSPAGFDLDDVVRGGRRRRRRRTVAQVSAAAVAVVALSAGIALPQLGRGDGGTPFVPATAPPASSAPALPGIDLGTDLDVTYKQAGRTVTLSRKGTELGTMTLLSADYGATSAHVVFAFAVSRELIVERGLFILWDGASGENSASDTTKLTLPPGSHTVALDFRDLRSAGEAVGWAPANGDAVWPKTE